MVLLILIVFVIFSGCVEENNDTQSSESVYNGLVNITPENLSSTTQSSEEGNVPEIEVTSFSSIYMHDNCEIDDEYIFNWDNVPGNESQRLILYLKRDLNTDFNWINDAQIVKTNDNETIRIFKSENVLEFTLKNNETEILVNAQSHPTIGFHPLYNWKIRKESGNIRVYGTGKTYKSVYNITERRYLVYDLSIKNKGSKNLNFKLNELNLRDENNIYNAILNITIEPANPKFYSYRNEILSDLENENKLKNATLFPEQTINGSAIFQINSSYDSSHNESFQLLYKQTPIISASFEKSTRALRAAERYNYSVVFGSPPYYYGGDLNSYEPEMGEYPFIWPNWVNRSIVEFFKKADSDEKLKYSSDNIPPVELFYVLKVIPERNITSILEREKTSFLPVYHFIIIDDTGEELINTSSGICKIAILENQTYELYSGENVTTPQMNFSNATIVKISYENVYNRPMADRLSIIDQDLILDDKMNIVVARYHCLNAIG